jgi:hypothetical protein
MESLVFLPSLVLQFNRNLLSKSALINGLEASHEGVVPVSRIPEVICRLLIANQKHVSAVHPILHQDAHQDPSVFYQLLLHLDCLMRLETAIEHSNGNALGHRQITQAFRHDDLISQ